MRPLLTIPVFILRAFMASAATAVLAVLAGFAAFPGPYGDMLAFGGIVAFFFLAPYHLVVMAISGIEGYMAGRHPRAAVRRAFTMAILFFSLSLLLWILFFALSGSFAHEDWRTIIFISALGGGAGAFWGFLYWTMFTLTVPISNAITGEARTPSSPNTLPPPEPPPPGAA